MKARHAFTVAAGIVFRMVVVCGACMLDGEIVFHTNRPAGMVMMGNNSHDQHDDVDKK